VEPEPTTAAEEIHALQLELWLLLREAISQAPRPLRPALRWYYSKKYNFKKGEL
jgi:hypothetical protein